MQAASWIDEELLRRLPLPLGQLARRASNAKTALERHQAAYYLWEAALKLLGATAVAEYAELREHDPPVLDRLRALARPSLGHWWEFVRRLLPILGDAEGARAPVREARDLILGRARDDLPRAAGLEAALREALDESTGARSTVRLTELFDRVVRYRNQEMGHGASGHRSGEFYERLGAALLLGTGEVLSKLDVLLGSRLIFIGDVRLQTSGRWLVERYELVGEAPRRLESLDVDREDKGSLLRPTRVYLERGNEFLALHPLALFDAESGEFFFLSARRGAARAQYLSYSTGRMLDRDELGQDQRELFANLFGAPVGADESDAWARRSLEEAASAEPPQPEPSKPRRSVGEFELLSRIGRGGMGVVYRAWQPSLARQVALKCLLGSGDPKVEARFAREIRALGRVDHPNLVKVFTSGSDGNQWFYAMELIEGADLGSVLGHLASTNASDVDVSQWDQALSTACLEARRKEESVDGRSAPATKKSSPAPVPADEVAAGSSATPPGSPVPAPRETARGHIERVVALLRQAADAAHALHEAGVLHRDIKPGNIMVTEDGKHVVLMDLGVAQLADEQDGRLTRTRQFVGTLRYASPEQVLAVGSLDRRTDVYSLGATLFELLTLSPLFGANDQTATPDLMLKIQNADPGRPSRINPRIPRDLESVVLKCLEKDRARRYVTARDLAADLARFERGEAVEAQPATLGYLLAKHAARHRGRYAAVAVLLLLAIVGAATSFWRIRRSRDEAVASQRATEVALFDAYTDRGIAEWTQSLDAGPVSWFAKASEIALHDTDRQAANLGRLAAVSKDLPRPLRLFLHPGERIVALEFHPSSSHLLLRAQSGLCALWDVAKETEALLPGGKRHVGHAAWTPDGTRIFIAAADGDVALFAFPGGARLKGLPGTGPVRSFAMSGDGRWLALQRDRLRIWDLRLSKDAGVELHDTAAALQLSFDAPGRRLLAACEDGRARVFTLPDAPGPAQLAFEPVPHVVPDRIAPIWIDEDRGLVTVTGHREVSRWNADGGKRLGAVRTYEVVGGTRPWVTALTASPGGARFAVVRSHHVDVFRSASGRRLGLPLVDPLGIDFRCASFDPSGEFLLTGSGSWRIQLWRAEFPPAPQEDLSASSRPRAAFTIVFTGFVDPVAWSRDGRYFASGDEKGTINVFRPPPGDGSYRMPGTCDFATVHLSLDGAHFVQGSERGDNFSFSRGATVYRAADGAPVSPFIRVQGRLLGARFTGVEGRLVTLSTLQDSTSARARPGYAFWQHPGVIQFWEWRAAREVMPAVATRAEPLDAGLSADGARLAVVCGDGEVLLVDTHAGRIVESFEHGARAATIAQSQRGMVAFSADGRSLATWHLGTTARLWEVGSSRARCPPLEHAAPVTVGGFSPDGSSFLTASGDDVRVFKVLDGSPAGKPLHHGSTVFDAVFDQTGQRILTGCNTGSAYLWNWADGSLVSVHGVDQDRSRIVEWIPDSHWFLSASLSQVVLWDAEGGKLIAPLAPPDRFFVPLSLALEPHGQFVVAAGRGVQQLRLDGILKAGRAIEPKMVTKLRTLGDFLNSSPFDPEVWRAYRAAFPEETLLDTSREATVAWHRKKADSLEREGYLDAAQWHLERLRDLGEPISGARLDGLERFVRSWRFAQEARQARGLMRAFEELSSAERQAIEASARSGKLVRSPTHEVDFQQLIDVTPSDVAAYAQRTIVCDRPMRARLLVGSDDAIRIWRDGEIIFSHFEGRGAAPDQNETILDLRQGENSLLVELSQNYDQWRFFIRFEDEGGRPLRLTDEGGLVPLRAE